MKVKKSSALAGVTQWIDCWPVNQSPVRFPIRAHAWIAGQSPIGGVQEATID